MNKRLAVFLALVLWATTCLAQQGRGTLTGIVKDSSGGVVPEVQITITNTDNNAVYKSASTGAGAYSVPNLPVGPYKIEFESAGFKKLERSNIQLSQGQVVRVDVTMEVGAVTESVQVTAELSRVETDTPRVAIDMSNRQVRDMPISLTALTVEDWVAKVTPGVSGSVYDANVNGLAIHNTKVSLIDGLPVGSSEQNSWQGDSPAIAGDSGVQRPDGRLLGGIWTRFQWRLQLRDAIGHQSVARRRLGRDSQRSPAGQHVHQQVQRPGAQQRPEAALGLERGRAGLPSRRSTTERTRRSSTSATSDTASTRVQSEALRTPAYPIPDFYNGDFSRLMTTTVRGTDALGRNILQGTVYDPSTIRLLPSGRYIADPFLNNKISPVLFSKVSQTINKIGVGALYADVQGPRYRPVPANAKTRTPGRRPVSRFRPDSYAMKGTRTSPTGTSSRLPTTEDASAESRSIRSSGYGIGTTPRAGRLRRYFIQDYTHWRAASRKTGPSRRACLTTSGSLTTAG